jgi:hypothetical protein
LIITLEEEIKLIQTVTNLEKEHMFYAKYTREELARWETLGITNESEIPWCYRNVLMEALRIQGVYLATYQNAIQEFGKCTTNPN